MKRNLIFGIMIIIGLFASSCNTTLYVPNTVNAPLLKEKGEVKASIGGNNFQAAYGLTNNVGIIGNVFWDKYEEEITENNTTFNTINKGNLYELGIGYFTGISENVVFETYAGGGIGRIDFDNERNGKNFEVNATKFFIQPAVGYVGKFFDVAFTPRLSAVKYSDLRTSGYTPEELNTEYLNKSDVEDKTWVFAEPALTVRVGYKFVKLQFQTGFVSKLTKGDLKYESKFTNLGVSFNLAKWYRD